MTEESKNLKHIKVEGFKSIAKLDLPMENINILIGANGSGKNNLISLFTFLSHLSKGKLKNFVETEGGAERFFHFGTKNTSHRVFDLKVGMNGYHVELSPNIDDDSLVFVKEYCTIETSPRNWTLESRKGESGFIRENASERSYVEKYTYEFLEKCRVYHFHDTGNQARFKKTNKLVNYHYLEKDAANIAPFLFHLKNSKVAGYRQSYQQIVSTIQTVAPFFHDFYLEPTGDESDESILLRWTHIKHDAPFSANVLSDGTARFICLATLFLQPKSRRPDTIILDEPELGLHPAALDVLADIIHATAKDTQVICSTQSVAFANLFAPEEFIVADAEDGVSRFRRLKKESLEHWLEEYGMGDIWAKNLIGGSSGMVRLAISVEGPTEERFVHKVMVPYLEAREIYTVPLLLGRSGGDVSLLRVKKDLNHLARSFDKVTTLYGFYGFRGKDKAENKESLEQKIVNSVTAPLRDRIIPYVQMYEFEGLLFSSPEAIGSNILQTGLSDWAKGILNEFDGDPEKINDSKDTAPSKRLLKKADYIKTVHGPDISQEIGLDGLREKCSGFDAWLTQLEGLKNETAF